MEAELLRAQKLESVGLLAGGIAHDFNNILMSILGNISLSRMEGVSPEEVTESLSEAEAACEQAKNLTQQLLTFSKGGNPVKKNRLHRKPPQGNHPLRPERLEGHLPIYHPRQSLAGRI